METSGLTANFAVLPSLGDTGYNDIAVDDFCEDLGREFEKLHAIG
jgi:hypothetical protein